MQKKEQAGPTGTGKQCQGQVSDATGMIQDLRRIDGDMLTASREISLRAVAKAWDSPPWPGASAWSWMDRSLWSGDGWQAEPDKVTWVHEPTGLLCMARRSTLSGGWCGYVALPCDNAAFGLDDDHVQSYLDKDDEDCDVHGGITYAGFGENVSQVPPGVDKNKLICDPNDADNASTKLWWVGFDCGHCDDRAPVCLVPVCYDKLSYCTLAFVKGCCESLARAAAKF